MTDISFTYVNLDHRVDRREHAEAQFQRHGMLVDRFPAHTPSDWHGDEKAVARMRARTPGAIGCMVSQMGVIKAGAISGVEVIGVFEDDVVLCDDFPRRLEYILDNLPEDWDVFYLGATFHVPGVWCHHKDCSTWGGVGKDAWPTDNPRIIRCPGAWGTYAYLVNGSRAAGVINALHDIMPDCDGIDHGFIRIGTKLNTYCLVPGCAKQYDNQSDIGTGITKFSGFASLGPYWYAERMENFDPATLDWETGATLD